MQLIALAAALAATVPLHTERPDGDKAGYSLLDPTPRERMRDMSTDRPDTTESPYTVDAGHVQLEMSFADYSFDRRNRDSETRRSVAIAPLLIKAGLSNSVDVQIGIDPYTRERVTDRSTGVPMTTDGFGDIVVRVKANVWGNDGGETAFAIMPFVKFPTASDDLGNGALEGGIILPLAVALTEDVGLGLMAEFDMIRSEADDRYVVDFIHSAAIGRALAGDLGGFIEYAGAVSLDGGERYRGSLITGLTYAVTPDAQLDAGIRIGLTEAAEDLGLFAGLSLRY